MVNKMKIRKKPIVYIETTIPSYLVARPSNDLDNYYRQVKTQEWWTRVLPHVEPVVSVYVISEASLGNVDAAKRRIDAIKNFAVLEETDDLVLLAKQFEKKLSIPIKAQTDAFHLACSVIYGVDYVLSWNFEHIVGAPVKRTFSDLGRELDIIMPTLCTPEELMEI